MTKTPQKDRTQIAFEMLEHVFTRLNTAKERESNRHPVGDPNRVEADISQLEKAHLDLIRAKLDFEIADRAHRASERAARSSDRLALVGLLLTVVLAISAVVELSQ